MVSCPWCGHESRAEADAPIAVAPVAETPRHAKAKAKPTAPVPQRAKQKAHVVPPPKPKAEEDDERPYELPVDKPVPRCPSCNSKLPEGATRCPKCGFDPEVGRVVEKVYTPIDKIWEAGGPFQRRFTTFLILQAVNAITALWLMIQSDGVAMPALVYLFAVAMQAFLLGSFDRIQLTRSRKGNVKITRTWRFLFVEQPPMNLKWRECDGVMIGKSHEVGILDWYMFLVLLPFFVFPAIIWWWLVIHPDRFFVALTKDHGYPEEVLYRGLSEERAQEIADAVKEATGL